MDHFTNLARVDVPDGLDDGSSWAGTGTTRLDVATVAGGQVERRQRRDGGRLQQTVEVRRRDGSVWIAYDRQLALPADPTEAGRAMNQAACVLDLLAGAVAAADNARQARGAMLEWEEPTPPWAANYG